MKSKIVAVSLSLLGVLSVASSANAGLIGGTGKGYAIRKFRPTTANIEGGKAVMNASVNNGLPPGVPPVPSIVSPTFKGYSIVRNIYNTSINKWVQINNVYAGNPGTSAQTGGTIELRRTGVGTWQAVINGTTALTMPVTCKTNAGVLYSGDFARGIDVGIEVNDTTGTFTNNTTADVTVKKSGASYAVEPAVDGYDGSNGITGWATQYNATTGRVTMTK